MFSIAHLDNECLLMGMDDSILDSRLAPETTKRADQSPVLEILKVDATKAANHSWLAVRRFGFALFMGGAVTVVPWPMRTFEASRPIDFLLAPGASIARWISGSIRVYRQRFRETQFTFYRSTGTHAGKSR